MRRLSARVDNFVITVRRKGLYATGVPKVFSTKVKWSKLD